MNTRLQEDQARAAVAVGADMRRGNLVMHFVMAGCVQVLAGIVAGLALMVASGLTLGFVKEFGADGAASVGLAAIAFLAWAVPATFLLSLVVGFWSLLPLAVWLRWTARRSWGGLVLALASSALALAALPRQTLESSGSSVGPGVGADRELAGSGAALFENLLLSPGFLTGWYLMPLVCWLWLPLRFESVWWRLPLFATAGAVAGCLLGPGAGGSLSDQGWAVVASHATYLAGLMWCRRFHRRSADFADFGHPSRGRRPAGLPVAAAPMGTPSAEPETRA